MKYEYVDQNRAGDHICYISNLTRFQKDYPRWQISKYLNAIFTEIIEDWKFRLQD
jgi:CDP-paratose 2-epimerase